MHDAFWPCRLILLAAFVVGVSTQAADTPGTPKRSIYATIQSAVARGEIDKLRLQGFGVGGTAYSNVPREGGLLIGFDLAVAAHGKSEMLAGIRPVYQTANGTYDYREFGRFTSPPTPAKGKRAEPGEKIARVVSLRAKSGYAVGGLTVRSSIRIHGITLICMRQTGLVLDPAQSYTTSWGKGEGGDTTVSGKGAPIVGIYGNLHDDRLMAVGLIALKTEDEKPQPQVAKPAPPPTKVAPAPSPKAVAAKEKPEVKPAEVKPAEENPPVEQPQKVEIAASRRYRDARQRFSFEIPPGWQEMNSRDITLINNFVQQKFPGKGVRYDTGFMHRNARVGSFPYMLLQLHPGNPGGTYEDIEKTLALGLNGPLREVKGALGSLVKDLTVGTPVLDRANNRVVMRLQMDAAVIGRIQSFNVSHLGANTIVSLHSYAKDEAFDRTLPTFLRMNDSFRFDEGLEFVPAQRSTAGVAAWLPVAVFAGVGLTVLVPLVLVLRRKNRPVPVAVPPGPTMEKQAEAETKVEQESAASVAENVVKDSTSEGICSNPVNLPRPWQSNYQPPAAETGQVAPDVTSRMNGAEFFLVQTHFAMRSNRPFRIYVLPEELLFLEAGPGDGALMGTTAALAAGGGLVGALIGAAVKEVVQPHVNDARKSREWDLDLADLETLQQMARAGDPNFHAALEDLSDVRIEAPTTWEALSMKGFGWLRLKHRTLGEYNFEFLRLEDMRQAIELLQPVLGEGLLVNAVLDRKSWKYVRRV